MSDLKLVHIIRVALLGITLCGIAEARDWRFSSGGTISGEFSSSDGKMVSILRQGTRFNYPLSAFSKEDQDYVAKCLASGGRALDSTDTTGLPAPQDVVSRYTFDSQETEHSASHYNVIWKEGRLELNGIYGTKNQGGYRAVFPCPRLDYSQFTVAALIKPEGIGDPLLVGGTGYRWLKVVWEKEGRLVLGLNNSRLESRFDGVRIQQARWHTLVVTFDLSEREVRVFLDGVKAGEVKLPKDFKLDVVGTDAETREKEWTTTDYAIGRAFKGSLDELVVYKRALSPKEASSLKLGGNKPTSTQTAKPPNMSLPRTATPTPAAALPSDDLKRTEMRTWTDVRGNQVTALFVGLADGKISLRTTDGHVHNFPLSEFTAEDQALARKMQPGAPASVGQPPSTPTTKGAVGKSGMLRFELQGYEVSQDTAASIFIAQPDDFDPRAMLTTTAAMVGSRKAKLVQLPFIEAFSGARAVATPVRGYSLNAQLTLGRDNRTIQVIYILRRASDQAGSSTEAVTRKGDVAFLGTLPGAVAGSIVLVFCRSSQL